MAYELRHHDAVEILPEEYGEDRRYHGQIYLLWRNLSGLLMHVGFHDSRRGTLEPRWQDRSAPCRATPEAVGSHVKHAVSELHQEKEALDRETVRIEKDAYLLKA